MGRWTIKLLVAVLFVLVTCVTLFVILRVFGPGTICGCTEPTYPVSGSVDAAAVLLFHPVAAGEP